jgi:hypothetical protein
MSKKQCNVRTGFQGGWYMTKQDSISSPISHLPVLIILAGLVSCLIASPAWADRNLEWRDGQLWVVSDPSLNQEDILFPPLADVGSDYWPKPAAVMSPDDEWVAFALNTGGGFEGEGQSCYIARWNGDGEKLILETTRIIENIWWLEGDAGFYIGIQLVTGGTAYRSYFQVVDPETLQVVATVEGRVYGTSQWGARYMPDNFDSIVGLRYEILSYDEEPYRWGIYYVDELIQYTPPPCVIDIDGTQASQNKLIDGDVRTAWVADSAGQLDFTITFADNFTGRTMLIQSGYQWHEPPPEDGLPWDDIDWWPLYDRPREILATFSDGREMEISLEDTRSIQTFYIPEEYELDQVRFTVLSVYRGLETGCAAIGEISFY